MFLSWFDSNVNEILKSLDKNVFYMNKNNYKIFNRGIVLQGLKGSGKTTLCKYICNLLTKQTDKTVYFYINCQNFMSKFLLFQKTSV
jgi:Cdc6-like AAA superfamily ATPase